MKYGEFYPYGQKLQELPPSGSSRLRLWKSRGKDSLHVALVGLDHLLRRVTHRIVKAGNPCGVWLF